MISAMIIDSDAGIDDALAILTLVGSNKFNISLINATSGNVTQEQAYRNIRAILGLAGKKIKVSKGNESSLSGKKKRAQLVHGRDGLGNTFLAAKVDILNPLKSPEAIERSIKRENVKKILTLGPLTNIAQAFIKYPSLENLLDEIWIMGGQIKVSGNTSAGGEFNFYFDPYAAEIVLSSAVKKRLITLDVTQRVLFDRSFIDSFIKKRNKIYDFIARILDFSYRFSCKKRGLKAAHLPDLVAACLFLNKRLCNFRKLKIDVDKKTGCLLEKSHGWEIWLATNLKRKEIKEMALCNLLKLGSRRR